VGRGVGFVVLALALACGGDTQPVHRVLSVSDATTRVARALELGDQLRSLDPNTPDALTRALASSATLVISDGSAASAGVRAAFASRSVAERVFSPTSTQEALSAYTEIATVLGKPKAAGALIARVTRELGGNPSAKRQKVALVLQRSPLRVVGGGAYLSHLLETAGIDNAFASESEVSLLIQPARLEAAKPDRVLDVTQAALDSAWADPVGSVRALTGALSSTH